MINHCALFATVSLAVSSAAIAHDDGDFAAWFRSLHNESGMSCCSEKRDCKEVNTYIGTDIGYKVLYNGVWVSVPWKVVLQNVDNPTGHPILCVMMINNELIARCFVRASES